MLLHSSFARRPLGPRVVLASLLLVAASACLSLAADEGPFFVPTGGEPPVHEEKRVEAHKGALTTLAFSADGKLLASAGEDGAVHVWEFEKGARRCKIKNAIKGRVACLAISPDGRMLLVGGAGRTIIGFDPATGKKLKEFQQLAEDTRCLAWRPNGEHFAAVGADNVVRVFDADDGKVVREEPAPLPPTDLMFDSTGITVYVAMPMKGVGYFYMDEAKPMVWNVSTKNNDWDARIVARTSNNELTATIGTGKLFYWKSGGDIEGLRTQLTGEMRIAFSSDGAHILAFGGNGALSAWKLPEEARVLYHKATDDGVSAVALAEGGSRAASGHEDGAIRFWRIDEPNPPLFAEQSAFQDQVATLLTDEKFAELDELGNALRESKARLPVGLSKLEFFYEVLSIPYDQTDENWQTRMDLLSKWRESRPQSSIAKIAHAAAWIVYAWYARGSGPAIAVTQEGQAQFQTRLNNARALLDDVAMTEQNNPAVHHQLLMVAKGQGWSKEDARQALDKVFAIDPEYHEAYLVMAEFLLPRWHGEPGDLEAFADEAANRLGGDKGEELYFRIASGIWPYYGSAFFTQTEFDYQRIRTGGKALLMRYPEAFQTNLNRPLNQLCRFACQAGDMALAHELFVDLGNNFWMHVWRSEEEFSRWRDWAQPEPEAGLALRSLVGHTDDISWVAFSPDASLLATCAEDGSARIWQAGDGKKLNVLPGPPTLRWNQIAFHPKEKLVAICGQNLTPPHFRMLFLLWNWETDETTVLEGADELNSDLLAFSPDGRWLAGNTSKDILLWEIASPEKPRVLAHHEGVRLGMTFYDDSRTLAICGRGEMTLWEVESGKLRHSWKSEGLILAIRPFFSKDGRMLASKVQKEDDVQVRDVETGEIKATITAPKTFGPMLSPDGRTLVTTSADEIVLWEVASSRQLARVAAKTGLAKDFSPDGRLLAIGCDDFKTRLWEVEKLLSAGKSESNTPSPDGSGAGEAAKPAAEVPKPAKDAPKPAPKKPRKPRSNP